MRTDVKVGLICALAIVLCVVVYFVTKGRTQPVAAHADVSVSHVTPNSDLHPASPGTPGNPVVSSDPYLPDHTLAGNPIGGGVIRMPGDVAPAATQSAASAAPAAGATGAGGTSSVATGATGSPAAPGMGAAGVPGAAATGSIPTIGSGGGQPSAPWNPLASATTTAASPTRATVMISGLGGAPASTAGATTYKIQKGDMLIAIAKKNGVTLKALQAANPGVDSNHLKIGDSIKIPAATPTAAGGTTGTTSVAGTGATPSHLTVHNTPVTGGAAAHPVSTAVTTTIKPGSVYVIKKGDTLASISKAAYGNNGGTQKIFRANRDELNDPDVMPVGASIKIP